MKELFGQLFAITISAMVTLAVGIVVVAWVVLFAILLCLPAIWIIKHLIS